MNSKSKQSMPVCIPHAAESPTYKHIRASSSQLEDNSSIDSQHEASHESYCPG